jgi:hypothetical protein
MGHPAYGGVGSDQRLDLARRGNSAERWLRVRVGKDPHFSQRTRNGAPASAPASVPAVDSDEVVYFDCPNPFLLELTLWFLLGRRQRFPIDQLSSFPASQ